MNDVTIQKLKQGYLIILDDDYENNLAIANFTCLIRELRILFDCPAKVKPNKGIKPIAYPVEQEVIISGKTKPHAKFVKTLSQKDVDELKVQNRSMN